MTSPVGDMRRAVLIRDQHRCRALDIDPDAGPCYNEWGVFWRPYDPLEVDYVRRGHRGARHELPSDHVSLCAGHHRGAGPSGGRLWATAHRAAMREWLDGLDDAR